MVPKIKRVVKRYWQAEGKRVFVAAANKRLAAREWRHSRFIHKKAERDNGGTTTTN